MTKLILAAAAVLSLGIGSAFAATTNGSQNQQQLAMSTQANGAQTYASYGQAPASQTYGNQTPNGYVGGYQPVPPYSSWGGD